MPRTYARIAVSRSSNEGWRALTFAEQGCYDFLLAHPKLSLCGVLDVKLGVWQRTAADAPDTLLALLASLEDQDYVAWDRDTDELALRTFVRHDGVLQNRNLAKGMWSAWSAVESPELRQWLVDNFPEPAFGGKCEPPETALKIRSPNHRCEPPSEPVSELPHPQPHLNPASARRNPRWVPNHMRGAGDNDASDGARLNGTAPVVAGTNSTQEMN